MTKHSPFRYFKTSPEITRLAVMLFVRFSLSLRDVEDLLHELGIFVVVGKLSKKPTCCRCAHFILCGTRHASAMIAMGMDIKNLQERLGHTSPTVTLNTYGHLYQEQKRDVNKRALNAWEASLRDFRDKSHDNLLKIVDGSAKL